MRMMKPVLFFAVFTAVLPVLAQGTWDQYYAAGNQCYSAKDYEKAVLYYKASIQLDPNQAASRQGLGNAYFAQGNKKAALPEYEKSLELNRDNQALMEFISQNFKEFGARYDIESKAFVDRVVPAICRLWDEQVLFNEACPELADGMRKDQAKVDHLFYVFKKKLGSLLRYGGSEGGSTINFSSEGKTITCEYTCEAEFELGKASLSIKAIYQKDQWKLLLFKVNSDKFLQDL